MSSSSGPGACASCWVYQASEALTSLSQDLSGVSFIASNLEELGGGAVYPGDEERVCFLPALEEVAAPRSGLLSRLGSSSHPVPHTDALVASRAGSSKVLCV